MASPVGRLAAKSIHITPFPYPTSLAESKHILSALQKFGEVVTFRNLKYDTTNSSTLPFRPILAIFDSPDAAKQALEASPLTVPLPKPDPTNPSASTSTSTSTPTPTSTSIPNSRSQFPSTSAPRRRSIKCELHPSRHNHASAMLRNPFHTMFRVYEGTYQFQDLVRTGIPLRELADETSARKRHEPLRTKRKIARENRRLGAESLMRLYREGLGEVKVEEEVEIEEEDGERGRGREAEREAERDGER